LKKDVHTCQVHNAEIQIKLDEALEAAKCKAHRDAISQLKKHRQTLQQQIVHLTAAKRELTTKVAVFSSKLTAYKQLTDKLRADIKDCKHGHVGCHSSIRTLKNQLLSHLRKLKHGVSSVTQLQTRIAELKTELTHTQSQWKSDRASYKVFRDSLLAQMAKLIALAKDAKRKFDIARAAAKNELKVQDAQWGVCRKSVLNYERMLGAGVVKAEKEKLKAFLATRHYQSVKKQADKAVRKDKKINSQTKAQLKAMKETTERLEKMRIDVAKRGLAASHKTLFKALKTEQHERSVVRHIKATKIAAANKREVKHIQHKLHKALREEAKLQSKVRAVQKKASKAESKIHTAQNKAAKAVSKARAAQRKELTIAQAAKAKIAAARKAAAAHAAKKIAVARKALKKADKKKIAVIKKKAAAAAAAHHHHHKNHTHHHRKHYTYYGHSALEEEEQDDSSSNELNDAGAAATTDATMLAQLKDSMGMDN